MDSGLFLVDLPASRAEPSHHSVSNHLSSSCDRDLVFVPQAYRQDDPRVACVLSGPCVTWTSPLGSRLVTTKSRIEFVILRTGSSPPVALHLPSRGRSYLLLQNADHALVGTLTPLVHHAHRRTACCARPACQPLACLLTKQNRRHQAVFWRTDGIPSKGLRPSTTSASTT